MRSLRFFEYCAAPKQLEVKCASAFPLHTYLPLACNMELNWLLLHKLIEFNHYLIIYATEFYSIFFFVNSPSLCTTCSSATRCGGGQIATPPPCDFKIENDKWIQWQDDYLIYCIECEHIYTEQTHSLKYTHFIFAYFIMDFRSKNYTYKICLHDASVYMKCRYVE